jgi:acyl-CoA synthetase (AMP-forming)/AMP-acid ligase II
MVNSEGAGIPASTVDQRAAGVDGRGRPPVTGLTLGTWMGRRAHRTPDRVALRFEDDAWTYKEFDDRVRRLAQALRARGIRFGDRVAFIGPNHPAFLELLFAASSLGAITVPVNYRLPAETVEHVMGDAGCRLAVASRSAAGVVDQLRGAALDLGLALLDGADGADSYEGLVASGGLGRVEAPVRPDDVALLVYSSGTTGLPKGITLTHANLVWNVMNMLVAGDLRSDDVTLAIAPFFRIGSLGVTVLETLLLGGTVVLMAEFDAGAALALIEDHQVSVLFGGPDLMQGLISHSSFRESAFASVRVCYTGGAPVPRRLLATFQKHDIALIQGYGLSEAAPVVMILDPEDMLRKAGSAGRPVFFTDVRVARPDGTSVEPGEVGEIRVAGPNVMRGYWNREEPAEHLVDGWLRTGDAARIDDDGYITIVGRTADAYVSDGRLVHPGDIEAALRDHPGVADAAVVPIPDAHSGPTAVAVVEPVAGTALDVHSLRRWLIEHTDGTTTTPDVRVVERLPRNPAGKILRSQIPR